MRYDSDETDSEEHASPQGSRSNSAAQSKTRKETSQAYGDEDEENVRDTGPITSLSPPRHQLNSSFSFNNKSGIMINKGIGNMSNST
jgi:hypothetical protein